MGEMLEREELLETLSGLLDGGHLVFVGGEAGVGKTTLVRALGERAPCPVLHGSCEHLATRRTVDHHVSAILRKLDVRSRGAATQAALERGLLDDPR